MSSNTKEFLNSLGLVVLLFILLCCLVMSFYVGMTNCSNKKKDVLEEQEDIINSILTRNEYIKDDSDL